MRCPDCRGEIEGPRPFCPHCGRKFDGLLNTLASALQPDKGAAPSSRPQPQIDEIRQKIAENPVAIRLAVGAVGGAIAAGFIPGINWFIGALTGMFIAFRTIGKPQ